VILFNDLESAIQIGKSAGVIYHPGAHACIARVEEDGLRGGVIFTDYNFASIQVHMAAVNERKWLSREMLFRAFDYGFNVCGCNKLLGLVPESNKKALELNEHFGFTVEARITDVLPDGAMLVLGMYRNNCRFLTGKYNGKI
jgi:RimJ/RimL family protein N-acetyltransferase